MKSIAALLVLGLLGTALYFFVVRDRNFQSYSGAEIGMPVQMALSRLQSGGYVLLSGSSEIKHVGCSGMERYALVRESDPTYSLTVSVDDSCNIREIMRRLRGIEL